MRFLASWLLLVSVGFFSTIEFAYGNGPNWKATYRDAEEFEDAADDFHDRARTLRDPALIAAAAQYEDTAEQLLRVLKSNRTVQEVLPLVEGSQIDLSRAATTVAYNWQLREDRKLVEQLERSARALGSLNNRINYALEPQSPILRLPTIVTPEPWMGSGNLEPIGRSMVPTQPHCIPGVQAGSPNTLVPWHGGIPVPQSGYQVGPTNSPLVNGNGYQLRNQPSNYDSGVQPVARPALRFRIIDVVR